MPPLPEALRQLEQVAKPETERTEGAEAAVETAKPPETLEALTKQLLKRAREIGVKAVMGEITQAKVAYLQRSGHPEANSVEAQAMTAVNALFADLEAELQAMHDGIQSPEVLPQPQAEAASTAPTPVEAPKLKPLPPSIDGVRPPEDGVVTAGDNDDYEEAKTVEYVAETVTAVETADPYAERNSASQALLAKLQEPDLSIPGQSNMELLKNVRELLIMRAHDQLAVRTDFEGNIVIGVPEDNGNGLRTRLMTLHHDTDQGTVDWLRRSMRSELTILDRHKITVMDDPQLDHTDAALAA